MPLENQVQKTKVEELYLKKELVPETVITPSGLPKVVYRAPQSSRNYSYSIIGISWEQCVTYAKRVTGISRTLGYAGHIVPQGYEPQVGAIALERSIGHAMVVESIQEDGIVVTEANYSPGLITRRFVPYWDIRGYLYN